MKPIQNQEHSQDDCNFDKKDKNSSCFSHIYEGILKIEQNYPYACPIAYTIFSSLLFVLVSVGVKMLQNFSSSQILYFRSVISFIFSTVLMSKGGYSPFVEDKQVHKLLMVRSIMGGFGHFCFYKALHMLDISDAQTILLTSPLWTSLLAGLILKEKITVQLFLSIAISFIGILFVVQPVFLKEFLGATHDARLKTEAELTERTFGFVYGVLSAFISSVMIIIVRKLSGKIHNSLIVHYVLISCYMLGTIDMICHGNFNPDIFIISNFAWMVFIAVCNYSAQMIYSKALFMQQASKLAPFTYSQVVIGFIFQIAFFNEEIGFLSIIGSALVVGGNLSIALKK